MTPGKSYIFATDLIPYFEAKGIKIKKFPVGHDDEFRLVIQVKDDSMHDGFRTEYIFSNNFITDINQVGFTRQYLEFHFPKIQKIPEYSKVEISIDDEGIKERIYHAD